MPTKKSKSGRAGLKTGLGLAAIAAAAGAYYFFGSAESRQHRKQATAWANRAKKDLVGELKNLKTVSRKSYAAAAAQVLAKYKKFQQEHPQEYARLKQELGGQWQKIEKHLPKSAKQAVRQAKIAVKGITGKKKVQVRSK